MTTTRQSVRWRIRVDGIVQGVGFRPFVHGLASELGLVGFVSNDEAGVLIEAEGPREALTSFVTGLRERAPALAVITQVGVDPLPVRGDDAFTIAPSAVHGPRITLVSPDTATCADCLAELADPNDRRYRYPFTNCTNCGPRFTIVTELPYDRPNTTMAPFAMCAACAAEYNDPANRRFHAQPVCCPACGPRLVFRPSSHQPQRVGFDDDPLHAAAAALHDGAVVAIKGIGGFHLAALARREDAVGALRARKRRYDKPFAVMAPDLASARALCEVDDAEAAELMSRRAPIVLLRRRPGATIAPSVAPAHCELGVMLPYTPLHHLLATEVAEPIVLTSGNVSDEPIAYRDAEATERLGRIADAFLTHDRQIHVRADDSVVRVVDGRSLLIRRSRGYAPEPLPMVVPARRPILGCGAELKNTFCVARGQHAFVSHHIGDLENAETLRSFTEGIAHYSRLFDIAPQVVAHDLHPEYLSTKYAQDLSGVDLIGVQHHHAHLASCLVDNGETGPVVGIACDGLGYGADGSLWGGEIMEVSLTGFRRLGHIQQVPLPGGAIVIREPWRMAVAWLRVTFPKGDLGDLEVVRRNAEKWTAVERLLASAVPVPRTTSVGRLFDAVAALVGVRDRVSYEGQAAIELQHAADESVTDGYPCGIAGGVVQAGDLIRAVTVDVRTGIDVGVISARFHNGLATVLGRAAVNACAATGRDTVALSGGVFQNVLLLRRVSAVLRSAGVRVLTHSRVPPNDAGISIGQVAVAAAVDRQP